VLEIGVVAQELGVEPGTLRTWERRYRLIVPRRGPNGQRLYDDDQLLALRRVLALIRSGQRARAAHQAVVATTVRRSRADIPPSPAAPGVARETVEQLLADDGDERLGFFLKLAASELVTNAVRHGSEGDPIDLEVVLADRYGELRVRNGGTPLSLRSLRERRREGGPGLELVEAIASAWAIESGSAGTTITVRVDRDAL
jgi:DNA-binding transcriptional MerR regulator